MVYFPEETSLKMRLDNPCNVLMEVMALKTSKY